jgi:hypothetical protein
MILSPTIPTSSIDSAVDPTEVGVELLLRLDVPPYSRPYRAGMHVAAKLRDLLF